MRKKGRQLRRTWRSQDARQSGEQADSLVNREKPSRRIVARALEACFAAPSEDARERGALRTLALEKLCASSKNSIGSHAAFEEECIGLGLTIVVEAVLSASKSTT
jgi:hypothetical protein